ncbi:MAG: c-type cytochrome [Beijerinckiaceae bacterium]
MRDGVIGLTAAVAILNLACGGASAQSWPPPGAAACSGCHGGPNTAMPSLHGRSAAEIEAAMIAFRDGAREATVMDRIAKGFSEPETKAIAAWIAQYGAAR